MDNVRPYNAYDIVEDEVSKIIYKMDEERRRVEENRLAEARLEEERRMAEAQMLQLRRGRSRFSSVSRGLVATLLVCTLGTSTLGLGVGMGIPIAERFVIPTITGEPYRSTYSELQVDVSVPEPNPVTPVQSIQVGEAGIASFSSVIDKVDPCVVSINTTMPGSSSYFRISEETPGSGSGIIYGQNDTTIYIATNHHVVKDASKVTVSITGSGEISAKSVGSDAEADLAVISISKEDIKRAGVSKITIATFGDSSTMRVGDIVLAIGNVLGEGNTATMGIVSAVDKKIPVSDKMLGMIQTDAAINPGNSGGALINTKGEVIGINTAKLSQTSIEGMGYSIASSVAKPILDGLMQQKPQPFLGVGGKAITEEMAEAYGIPGLGVYIQQVTPNSAAEKAGLKQSDIIMSFNGTPILTMDNLIEEVAKCNIGDTVEINILRNGKNKMTVKATIGDKTSMF